MLCTDETCGRAAGALTHVHVLCTEYRTLMDVDGRTEDDIDAGGVFAERSGVLAHDGYAGCEHVTQVLHAWCGAHLLRDLRATVLMSTHREQTLGIGHGQHHPQRPHARARVAGSRLSPPPSVSESTNAEKGRQIRSMAPLCSRKPVI